MLRGEGKGFGCWSQFVAMMLCQLALAKSLREVSEGLGCGEDKVIIWAFNEYKRIRSGTASACSALNATWAKI